MLVIPGLRSLTQAYTRPGLAGQTATPTRKASSSWETRPCPKHKVGGTCGCLLAFTRPYRGGSPGALPRFPDHNSPVQSADHRPALVPLGKDHFHELYANQSFADFSTADTYLGRFSNS